MALPVVSFLISLSPIRCFSLSWLDSVAPFHAAQLASETKSKHQQQALTNILVLKDMFYASDIVLPVDFYDMRSFLVLADVSHRNNDRETGEFCSHEGRHWHFPAAPSTSPVQLPISTTHAIRSHPAQGQGALHLQVRAWAPRRSETVPPACRGSPGRMPPRLGSFTRRQHAREQLHVDIFTVLAGVGGKTRSGRIRTQHSDD